jgi:uncharacterized protein
VIEWPMIFLVGLLGSSHCIGMCGGFALALGIGQRHWTANLGRQMLYSLGRVFTYTAAGAMVGYGGWRLNAEWRDVINLQAILCIAAGFLLVITGLRSAGLLRLGQSAPSEAAPVGATCFAALLRASQLHNLFLGGVINGLLPCGLVYAFLALAASTGHMGLGALTMLLFGLGTMPVMVLIGLSGAILRAPVRQRVFMLAAWCVVVTGVISLWRGISFLDAAVASGAGCPGCP